MNLLNENVLVKLEDQALESKLGIILDQYAAPKATTGTVALAAENSEGVKAGDRVLIHPHTGDFVTVEEVRYKVLKAGDILGVLVEA